MWVTKIEWDEGSRPLWSNRSSREETMVNVTVMMPAHEFIAFIDRLRGEGVDVVDTPTEKRMRQLPGQLALPEVTGDGIITGELIE